MADFCDANRDNSGTSEPEVSEQDDDQKPMLPKQESIVLYTQAALSGGKMAKGTGRMGRRPRPLLLKQISETPSSSSSQRRLLLKQQSETNQGIYNTGKKLQLTHQDTPNIVISGDCDFYLSDEEDTPKIPLPVLPIVPPEPDSDEENHADTEDNAQLPSFLGVTQRYRRSSLVRMDAIKQPGGNTLEASAGDSPRRISVHGSLDLPKNTLKDLVGFRNARSFNIVDSEDDDTITISEINPSGKSNLLTVPGERPGKFKRKGSKRKRPSLRRLLTIAVEPQLDREALEERHNSRKKEKEERKKEKKERKLREKMKMEEDKYDEDGVRICCYYILLWYFFFCSKQEVAFYLQLQTNKSISNRDVFK